MKYIHDYQDGSFCESNSFMLKVDNKEYFAISDEDYQDLCEGKKKLENGQIVINTEYTESVADL